MASTLLLLLGLFWMLCAMVVFGAFFAALREDEVESAEYKRYMRGLREAYDREQRRLRFVHRMEREVCSQLPQTVNELVGTLTSFRDELEDARDAR